MEPWMVGLEVLTGTQHARCKYVQLTNAARKPRGVRRVWIMIEDRRKLGNLTQGRCAGSDSSDGCIERYKEIVLSLVTLAWTRLNVLEINVELL